MCLKRVIAKSNHAILCIFFLSLFFICSVSEGLEPLKCHYVVCVLMPHDIMEKV